MTATFNMEYLTIEHIAPYLPHELMVTFENDPYHHLVLGFEFDELIIQSPFNDVGTTLIKDSIPLLLPLSYLTKEILHNGERFVPMLKLHTQTQANILSGISYRSVIDFMPYMDVIKLYKWHFDIKGLIAKGLAIDINTIEQ